MLVCDKFCGYFVCVYACVHVCYTCDIYIPHPAGRASHMPLQTLLMSTNETRGDGWFVGVGFLAGAQSSRQGPGAAIFGDRNSVSATDSF